MPQQPAKELSGSERPLEPVAIRSQLNRLLAHSLFTHSKRYPVLLEYIVEQTLLGHGADLKERTIGVEAFGRAPEYDVNFDPIVRTCAAEVRKRLIQYYYDPAHSGELIIELFPGSYMPAFRAPVFRAPVFRESEQGRPEPPANTPAEPDAASVDSDAPRSAVAPTATNSSKIFNHRQSRYGSWTLALALTLFALVAGIAIGRYRPFQTPSNLDRFWKPITSSSNPVTYCLGEPADAPELQSTLSEGDLNVRNAISARLNVSDVLTLARAIIPLVHRHGAFRVLPASETRFEQLREGPTVLIGGFDNPWTLRLTDKLRYGFETRDGIGKLVDRKSADQIYWASQWDPPHKKLVRDYAIVARIHNTSTGQPLFVVAGILSGGTEAASEVLYNPDDLDRLLDHAPRDWDTLNIEAVIGTEIIDGHPGPPEILKVETWK